MARESSHAASNEADAGFAQLGACVGAMLYHGPAGDQRVFDEVSGDVERVLGCAPEDLESGRIVYSDLIHPDDREAVLGELQLATLECSSYQLCYRITTPAGEDRWLWELGTAARNQQRGSPSLRGWLIDVTNAPQTLAWRQAEALAAGVAHDLNNLLSIITAGAGLVARSLHRDHSAQAQLGQMREVVDSSARLVAQLSRLLGHRRPSLIPTSVNGAVQRMAPVLRSLLGENTDLVLDLDPDLDPVLASAVQVERILLNLAMNARDALPPDGRMVVLTRNAAVERSRKLAGGWLMRGDYVCLSMSDSGAGIAQASLGRIFQPGFSTKGGSGLGLATVQGIAQESGGAVEVRSEQGRGTTFEVYLLRCMERGRGPVSSVVEK